MRETPITGSFLYADMSEVKVQLDRAHLQARLDRGKEHCGPALAEQIKGDCIPFTPHAEGYLQDSARVEKYGEDHAVTWKTVYAAYQYYGCWPDGSHVIKNHNRDINPKATTMWCEAARQEKKSVWDEVAQREFVKGAGG